MNEVVQVKHLLFEQMETLQCYLLRLSRSSLFRKVKSWVFLLQPLLMGVGNRSEVRSLKSESLIYSND